MTAISAEQAEEQATPENTAGTPLLTVENLRVSFGAAEVVRGVSFTARNGECLAIVGESGSGKSVTARTLVGLTGAGSRVAADRIELADVDLTRQSERAWRSIRGRGIGFILQDADGLARSATCRVERRDRRAVAELHGWGTQGVARRPRRDRTARIA
jgi:peptide/nickel transport system ATP-binding protein